MALDTYNNTSPVLIEDLLKPVLKSLIPVGEDTAIKRDRTFSPDRTQDNLLNSKADNIKNKERLTGGTIIRVLYYSELASGSTATNIHSKLTIPLEKWAGSGIEKIRQLLPLSEFDGLGKISPADCLKRVVLVVRAFKEPLII